MIGTLIIPDIHDKIEQLKKIDRQFGRNLPRIYLGDWFDSFNQKPDERDDTLRYLARELGASDRTFLWGNHDWHYSSGRKFVCSGYRHETAQVIEQLLPVDWESYFTFHHEEAGWLLSHAGFNRPPSSFTTTDEMAHQVGSCRGGDSKEGGPLWLDWNREFVGLNPGIPYHMNQIVGHTTQPAPALKNGSVCLDTGLRYVGLLLSTGELETHYITGKKKVVS